jgi:hypothetical protein
MKTALFVFIVFFLNQMFSGIPFNVCADDGGKNTAHSFGNFDSDRCLDRREPPAVAFLPYLKENLVISIAALLARFSAGA